MGAGGSLFYFMVVNVSALSQCIAWNSHFIGEHMKEMPSFLLHMLKN